MSLAPLLTHGSYDWAEVELASGEILNDRSQIVFVGTHIGALLVPIRTQIRVTEYRRFRAHSPHTNHRLLSMNVALNGPQSISRANGPGSR